MTSNAQGIAYMVLGGALLSGNDALSKWLAVELAVTQVWCLRGISALLLIVIVSFVARVERPFAVSRPPMLALRALLFAGTTLGIVAALSLMPLVNVSAIVFATPLLIAVMSPALLGESQRGYRLVGALIGFLGVIAILKPGSDVFQLASLVAVGAAVLSALRDIVTRVIAQYESAMSILFWSNAAVLIVGLSAGLSPWTDWRAVSLAAWLALLANGALNVAAHFCVVKALSLGEASAVAPFRYTGLLWALVLGVTLFGELPDLLTSIGAVAIVVSGLYLLARERKASPENVR